MENRKIFPLIIFFAFLLLPNQIQSQEIRYGNLSDLISQIRNAMPGEDSYAFVVPTTTQMDSFRTMIQYVINHDYTVADSFAQELGYALYEWYDTAYGNTLYYVLMEPNANVSGGVDLGWGTFIYYPDGGDEVIIEVPHPYFDYNTWRVGFTTYQNLSNCFFLMAGTHRYANGTNPRPADVAHNTQNMFHVVHEEVSTYNQHALQVHGFSRSNHPGYPDVVLSNGTPNPSLILDSLEWEIITEGYTVGIFDGINYTSLGATTNTQGQFSSAHGYSFIHMELEYFIRANSSYWENVVDALFRTFNKAVFIGSYESFDLNDDFILYPSYPNPFNSSIFLRFKLSRPMRTMIKVYNNLGQNVKILEDGWRSPGIHSIVWDGSNENNFTLPSGIYYIIICNENDFQIQKVTLLK